MRFAYTADTSQFEKYAYEFHFTLEERLHQLKFLYTMFLGPDHMGF